MHFGWIFQPEFSTINLLNNTATTSLVVVRLSPVLRYISYEDKTNNQFKIRGEMTMIILTKLNNVPFSLNPDFIETIEETPDTTIKLVTKNIIIVKEPMQEVLDKIYKYRSIAGGTKTNVIPNIGDL